MALTGGVPIDEAKNLCLDVARATVRAPAPSGGKPIATTVGDELAEMLAAQLADRLRSVVPAALVRTLCDDLLEGADAIAEFLYGSASPATRRKVYYIAEHSRIPTFRMGNTICARKSSILAWIEEEESARAPMPSNSTSK